MNFVISRIVKASISLSLPYLYSNGIPNRTLGTVFNINTSSHSVPCLRQDRSNDTSMEHRQQLVPLHATVMGLQEEEEGETSSASQRTTSLCPLAAIR